MQLSRAVQQQILDAGLGAVPPVAQAVLLDRFEREIPGTRQPPRGKIEWAYDQIAAAAYVGALDEDGTLLAWWDAAEVFRNGGDHIVIDLSSLHFA